MKKFALILFFALAFVPGFASADIIIVNNDYDIDSFLEGVDLQIVSPFHKKLRLSRLVATPLSLQFCISRDHWLWGKRGQCRYENWDILDELKMRDHLRIIMRREKDGPFLSWTVQDIKNLVFRRPKEK